MAYEIQEAKELVVKAGKELIEKGLIARTWGNVSARISDTQFVITPSGRAYEDLLPMKSLLLISTIVHTRATLNRHRKRAFTLPLIVIIQQLISLFILTKRLRQSSASQV